MCSCGTNQNRSRGGSGTVGSTVAPCPPAPLSQAEANQLFNDLRSRGNIPFDYPDDCCYSRAHEMCRIMRSRGIPCRKVWNYAQAFPNAGLRADTPNHPSGHVNWRYHVAPVVPVRGDDGVVRDMVMDPSMFDRPVTVEEWRNAQHDPNSTIQFTGPEPYYRGPNDSPMMMDSDYSQTNSRLAEHRNARDLRRALGS